MAYATYEEFNTRYTTKIDAVEVRSHFLPFASAQLDAMLAPWFTVPFSSNNLTAKDVALDLTYLLILQRSKEAGDRKDLAQRIEARIHSLRDGREAMLTTSGEALVAAHTTDEVWSNTRDIPPLFELSPPFRGE